MIGFFYAQSEYSLLDNALFLDDLVKKAKEYGYPFVALADNNMHASIKFFKACHKYQIKPIIGLKTVIESSKYGNSSILLYALNNVGYQNLLKISSYLFTHNGVISLKDLNEWKKGLLAVTPGIEGEIEKNIIDNDLKEACTVLKEYTSFFEAFYLGIQKQNIIMQSYNDVLMNLDENIKILPIHKTCYLHQNDNVIFETIKQIGNQKYDIGDYYLKTPEELEEEMEKISIFDNVKEVYEKANVEIEKISKPLLTYPNEKGLTSAEYLSSLCYLGLKKRLNGLNKKEYFTRIEYELDIIKKMGYEDYFLIVWDYVKYAKKSGILVGPGRGSAAGSLVAYSLGITEIDPLEYGLLFERFLNPERVTMPDIDMDFPDDKRENVIQYVINKYGVDHVCNIATFGHFQQRLAIRDVAKIKQIPEYVLNEVLKNINPDISIKENLKDIQISKLMENEDIRNLLDISSKIEGLPKHISTHAAGLILSSEPITNNCAIMNSTIGFQTQIEANDLEEIGLLKMDFLGLKNLTLIDKIIKKANINIKDILPNDKKTYQLLSNGLTNGIFQLESQGMKKVLKKLMPNNMEDIIAVLALYRPGPMEQIDEFIERKNGKEFRYLHPMLEKILKSTYGIIVYQEQIMLIAHDYAGYSLGEADILRRAVSKKKADVLQNERDKFVERSKDKENANKIYDYIVKFADYGFNRNHTVPYALISYQMAFLKANYPKEFISVLLTDSIGDIKKTISYIYELKKINIDVCSPNINISSLEYEVVDDKIYLPLTIVKNIGFGLASSIVEERKKGLFTTFSNFKERITINEKALTNLVFSCAFDCFNKTKKELIEGQNDVFGKYINDMIKKEIVDYSLSELTKKEEESIGINLKYSLMMPYKHLKYISISNDIEIGNIKAIGYIKSIKEITTKKKEKMAFIIVCDDLDSKEIVVFPKAYNDIKNVLLVDNVMLFYINVFMKDNQKHYELKNIEKICK